ncbi:hypothetical protein [Cyclobacterium xiamenense]|uniref:hypothetical protein n=1 Tax=Cyclobacterium xiamenense TaxID=1297121 RepID=UPI0035CF0C3B
MERLFKNFKRLMASLGVVAFLMVAGWQVQVGWGTSHSEAQVDFNKKIEALELAFAGSNSASCFAGFGGGHVVHVPKCNAGCPYEWYSDAFEIGTCSN